MPLVKVGVAAPRRSKTISMIIGEHERANKMQPLPALVDKDDDDQQHKQQEQQQKELQKEIALVTFISMALLQFVLYQWQRRHPRSYTMCTLIVIWLIPPLIAIVQRWLRFMAVWALYTFATISILRYAFNKHVASARPRLVYEWCYRLHIFTTFLSITGGTLLMLALLDVCSLLFNVEQEVCFNIAALLFFYGIYFGLLGRDFWQICAEQMATHMASSLPLDCCALCRTALAQGERTYKLSCGHDFHEFCVRGWCIAAKSQMCPYCKASVNLQRDFRHLCSLPNALYDRLLNCVRCLFAWLPLIYYLYMTISWFVFI